jgi:photosystem II CP43 chlorophyll apoprotein
VVGILHLISSALRGFGVIYYSILEPEIITSEFFAFDLIILGLGSLLVMKATICGGSMIYWAPGVGDVIVGIWHQFTSP